MFLLQGIDELFYFGLELHDGFALTRIFLCGSQQQEDEWHKKKLFNQKSLSPVKQNNSYCLRQKWEGNKNIIISNYLIDLFCF